MRAATKKRVEIGLPAVPLSQQHYEKQLRRVAIDTLGGPKCVGCCCDVYDYIQINHKNGGGNKDKDRYNPKQFYREIINGIRPKTDYDIRCIVCNAAHYAESKGFGFFEVTWRPL